MIKYGLADRLSAMDVAEEMKVASLEAEEDLSAIMDEYRKEASLLELEAQKEQSRLEAMFHQRLSVNSAASKVKALSGASQWEEHFDARAGCVYYFNIRSGKSQWKCPEELEKRAMMMDNDDPASEEISCGICLDIFQGTPVQCPAGHLYCKSCIEHHSTCPNWHPVSSPFPHTLQPTNLSGVIPTHAFPKASFPPNLYALPTNAALPHTCTKHRLPCPHIQ